MGMAIYRSTGSRNAGRRSSRRPLSSLLAGALMLAMLASTSGCIKRIWQRDDDAQSRLQHAPTLMLDQSGKYHMVVMQAPSPGWTIRVDSTERTPTGKRVYLTMRSPDPTYQYTQQIVQMRVLTKVRLETEIECVGRLLKHDEKAKGRGYGSLTIAESFE